jgi:hypothetical protein
MKYTVHPSNLVNSTSFERWFDVSKNSNDTCCLPEDQAGEIATLFDYFTLSPNSLYYDDKTQKVYPIESKSRLFSSINDVKETLPRYRKKYDKLVLYSIQLQTGPDSTMNQSYKVRFAVFPEESADHSPERGMTMQTNVKTQWDRKN